MIWSPWLAARRSAALPEAVCVGRDQVNRQLLRIAAETRCVLFFGGRQSGKSTTLKALRNELLASAEGMSGSVRVPVLMDLMRLPYDASPPDFFTMAAEATASACVKSRLTVPLASRKPIDLVSFELFLEAVQKRNRRVSLRFLYLVDEAKRMVGGRFPEAFRDNIFALLYGSDSSSVEVVLAGAQDLYEFTRDGTSPIGSRAGRVFLPGLSSLDVPTFFTRYGQELSAEDAELCFRSSGGHAGLLRHISMELEAGISCADACTALSDDRGELFLIWLSALSPEARVVLELLTLDRFTSIVDGASALRSRGFDPFRVERASQELQFTGICRRDGDVLTPVNDSFWKSLGKYNVPMAPDSDTAGVWHLIEKLEIALRRLVRQHYDRMWSSRSNVMIEKILGSESWSRIRENRDKSAAAYPYSPGRPERDILEFVYTGQLAMLIVSNQAWANFKAIFKDKQQFQEKLNGILPVRNDHAHFRTVPEKELLRCRINCEDLLVMLEQAP